MTSTPAIGVEGSNLSVVDLPHIPQTPEIGLSPPVRPVDQLSLSEYLRERRKGITRVGRQSKLTPVLVETALQKIRTGVNYEAALVSAGVTPATIHEWERQARAGVRRFVELFELIDQASAEWESEVVELMMLAGKGARLRIKLPDGTTINAPDKPDTKALMWILERHKPGRYHLASKTEVTGAGGGPVQIDVRAALVSKLERLAGKATAQAAAAVEEVDPPLDGEGPRGEGETGPELQLARVPALLKGAHSVQDAEFVDSAGSS